MTIQLRRLNHIAIYGPARGEEKARKFYGSILGLKEVALPKELVIVSYQLVWFKLFDFIIHITLTKEFIKPFFYENGVIQPGPHMALEVKQITKTREVFVKNHAPIHEAVEIADRKRFYVEDPFGNFIEIIEFHKDVKKIDKA